MTFISWQPNPYSLALVISGMLAVMGGVIASQRRGNPGAGYVVWLMGAIAIWSFGYALEMVVSSLQSQVLMAKIEYFGISSAPLLWFLFAMEYTGRGPFLREKKLYWLWIFPVFSLGMAWTNDFHHLLWSSTSQIAYSGHQFLSVSHGPVYWVHIAYAYTLILIGSIVFVRQAIKTRTTHRAQSVAILAAVLITWLGNLLYTTGLNPFPFLDITTFAMTITGLVCIFSLLRVGPLDLFPMVTETVLETMNDGILLVDEQDRIMYTNHAFRRQANIWPNTPVGKLMSEVLQDWPHFTEMFKDADNLRTDLKISPDTATTLYFDLRISPVIGNRKKRIGRVFVFHDITERKQAEQLLQPAEEGIAVQPKESMIPLVLVYRLKDGKIIEVNRTFILSLGYMREDAIGRTPLELGLWTAEQRASFMNLIRQDKPIDSYPIELHRKDGQVKHFLLTASRAEIMDETYITWLALEKI